MKEKKQFAGDGCNGDIAMAFAGKKFPPPLAEGGGANSTNGCGAI